MKPAEHLARRFHETYERLAPLYGYATREETRTFDPTTPNGKLMVAVCAEITDAAGMAHAASVLAEFAKTAPGRLPQRVQDAIDVALADGAPGTATPQDQAIYGSCSPKCVWLSREETKDAIGETIARVVHRQQSLAAPIVVTTADSQAK